MKILRTVFFVMLVSIMSISLGSCDDDEAERSLVGEWISTDDPYDVWIVDFYNNGYGRREERIYINNSPSNYQSYIQTFSWWADSRNIYVNFNGSVEHTSWQFYFRASYLYLDGVPFIGRGMYNSKKYIGPSTPSSFCMDD